MQRLGYFYLDNQSNAIYELSTKQQNAHQFLHELHKKMESKSELAFSKNPSISSLLNRVVVGYNEKLGLLQRIWECFLSLFSFFKIYLSKTQQIYHYAQEIENGSLLRKDDLVYELRKSLIDECKCQPGEQLSEMEIIRAPVEKLVDMGLNPNNSSSKVFRLAITCALDIGKLEKAKRSLQLQGQLLVGSQDDHLLYRLLVDYLLNRDSGGVRDLIELIKARPFIFDEQLETALGRCTEVDHILMLMNATEGNYSFKGAIARIIPHLWEQALSQAQDASGCDRAYQLASYLRESISMRREGFACLMQLVVRALECKETPVATKILMQFRYAQLTFDETVLKNDAIAQLSRALMAEDRHAEAFEILGLASSDSHFLSPLKEIAQEIFLTAMEKHDFLLAIAAASYPLILITGSEEPPFDIVDQYRGALDRLNQIALLIGSDKKLVKHLKERIEWGTHLLNKQKTT